jgi:hypothetical protein
VLGKWVKGFTTDRLVAMTPTGRLAAASRPMPHRAGLCTRPARGEDQQWSVDELRMCSQASGSFCADLSGPSSGSIPGSIQATTGRLAGAGYDDQLRRPRPLDAATAVLATRIAAVFRLSP